MKKLFVLLMLSLSSIAYSSESAGMYKCYGDFLKIAETRLKAVRESSASMYDAVLMIQETIGVDFDNALRLYESHSSPERQKLDADIDNIDALIAELVPFIKSDSGKKECRKRMKLEKERAKIADQLIRQNSVSVIEDMLDLRKKLDSLSDERLVGKWKGSRDVEGCSYLSWVIELQAENKFDVTFFSDPEQKQELATDNGQWNANPDNGMMILRTSGVRIPDILTYRVLNKDLIEYRTRHTGPTGDCGKDYSFTEMRID